MPGEYSIKLTVAGKAYTERLMVKMDPRSKTPEPGLMEQFTLSTRAWSAMNDDYAALEQVRKLREQLREKQGQTEGALTDAIVALDARLAALAGAGGGRGGRGNAGGAAESLARLNGELRPVA